MFGGKINCFPYLLENNPVCYKLLSLTTDIQLQLKQIYICPGNLGLMQKTTTKKKDQFPKMFSFFKFSN